VRRINYSMFKNVYFSVNQCNFGRFITSHMHSASEILRLWKLVYNASKDICKSSKVTITAAAKSPQQQQQQQQQQQKKPELIKKPSQILSQQPLQLNSAKAQAQKV